MLRRSTSADTAVDWAALVEAAPDGVLVSDAAGRYVVVNDASCRLLGRTREEIIGNTVFDLIGPDEAARMRELLATLRLEGIHRVEWRFRHPDGSEIPIDVHTRLLPSGHRQSILRDMRELARLRAAEQRALQARDEVLSVVAHDLGNPLNAILVQTQLMQRHSEPERRDTSVLAWIGAEGQRMNRLLTDLLDVAALDNGGLRQARAPLAPERIIAQAIQRLKVWTSFNRRELVPELATDLPDVFADPDRMAQVLDNLIANAVKFSPPDSRITLGAHSSEDSVVFRVHNSGPAIPMHALPHLFDRLWQQERHERRGVGLRLFIVKRVVELHGGRVWVESTLEAGTTFHFSIPTR